MPTTFSMLFFTVIPVLTFLPAFTILPVQRHKVEFNQVISMATTSVSKIKTTRPAKPEYLPESDGKPMAETDTHRKQMIALLDSLEEYFRADSNVYVTGNIFLYLPRDEDAGERQSVSPDIFVVRSIKKKERRIYDMEVEKKAPDVVIELTSRSTRFEDLGNKRAIYAELGVREYFIFDPLKEIFPEQLRGFRLQEGAYLPIDAQPLRSEVLGLDLVVEEGVLRLYDPENGERLRTHAEAEAARRVAETRAARETEARRQAEAELARLREELARLRNKSK